MDRIRRPWAKGLILALIGLSLAVPGYAREKVVEGTQGYRDEINRPPQPYKGPPRTGAQVYAYRCAACHAKNTQGAPMPGDNIEWGLRTRQGMGVLMQHTIDGYKQLLMPPRGGCRNCSDAELKAAVIYMLEQSGVEPLPEKILEKELGQAPAYRSGCDCARSGRLDGFVRNSENSVLGNGFPNK